MQNGNKGQAPRPHAQLETELLGVGLCYINIHVLIFSIFTDLGTEHVLSASAP